MGDTADWCERNFDSGANTLSRVNDLTKSLAQEKVVTSAGNDIGRPNERRERVCCFESLRIGERAIEAGHVRTAAEAYQEMKSRYEF